MKDTYFETYKSLDKSKLMTREEVLAFLKENGEHEPSLAKLSDQYSETFGIDPIWRYPLSDDMHSGAFIVPVQQGYLWIPYDEVDEEYYEILLPEAVKMLDEESCAYFLEQLRAYTDELCAVLKIIRNTQEELSTTDKKL